jgi:hypothetical protein
LAVLIHVGVIGERHRIDVWALANKWSRQLITGLTSVLFAAASRAAIL